MLEDVGEDGDVEGDIRFVGDHVRLHVAHTRMDELDARDTERPRADVDTDDRRAGPLGEIVGDAADAAADVEDALPRSEALDEELVIAREPVLGVDALAVLDCAAIHADVRVPVDLEQLAHRLPPVGLSPDRRWPEADERPPDAERKEKAEGAKRDAACGAAGDAAERQAAAGGHGDPPRAPR